MQLTYAVADLRLFPNDATNFRQEIHSIHSAYLLDVPIKIMFMPDPEMTIPADLQHFMRMFAVLRTVKTHIDPVTNEGEYDRAQLAEEINGWINRNPVFTKDDIECLKISFRKHNFPKIFWQGVLQEMRGKTYRDLFNRLAQDYERWAGSFEPSLEN